VKPSKFGTQTTRHKLLTSSKKANGLLTFDLEPGSKTLATSTYFLDEDIPQQVTNVKLEEGGESL